MSFQWYALNSSRIKTKDKFVAEVKKSSLQPKIDKIKDIIIYDFTSDNVGFSTEDSLLSGYVLIKIDTKHIREIASGIENLKLGQFLGKNKQGIPAIVSKKEVDKFQTGVNRKRKSFVIGDKVTILDGALRGFEGTVVKNNKLMIKVSVKLPNSIVQRSVNVMSLVHHQE